MKSSHEPASPAASKDAKPPHHTASKAARKFWYSLFVIVGLISVSTPLYNRVEPQLMGIPFFFWFTFAWVIVGALLTGIAYKCRI